MAKTIGFAIAQADEERLERLVQQFGNGNRSEFLREAMRQMEVIDRARRLSELQAYGAERAAAAGITPDDVNDVVKRSLRKRAASATPPTERAPKSRRRPS